MRMKLLSIATGALLVATAGPALGHHSFAAEFDANRPVKLEGTVTKMDWINPHAWLHMDVKGPDGRIVSWAVEGGAPNSLLRRGWNKNSVPTGTTVTVQGFRARDGSNRANGREVTLPDGKKLFIGSPGTGAPADGRDPGERR